MWLERHAGKIALLAIAVFVTIAIIDRMYFTVTPLNIPPPDGHLYGITMQSAQFWLEAMTEDLRTSFLKLHTFTLDLILPGLLAAALAGLTMRFAGRLPRFSVMATGWKLALSLMLPLIYAASDWTENFLTAELLWIGGEPDASTVGLLASATILKFTFLGFTLIFMSAAFFGSLGFQDGSGETER